MNDKNNYKTIYATVKSEILNGVYSTGSLLPTELNLAEKFGVSRPTISKVYNQLQKEGYVNKKKGMGTIIIFKDNSPKTYTFGLLLPGSGESEIFSVINDQILKQSKKMHFNCLWEGATASNADIRRNLIETCCDNYIAKGVDGILFSPLERVPDADTINRTISDKIRQAGIPLILIDRDIVPIPQKSPFDVISIDNYNAGCHMAGHLIEAGCSDIHFLYRPNSAYSVRMRSLGVKDTVQEAGLAFDEGHLHCADPGDLEYVKGISFEKGHSGIICANDSTAAVLMSTLDTLGIKVQEDVLVCGYDDMKYAGHLKYPLTSYRQPCTEIADVSVELMMRRLKNSDATVVSTTLTGQICERESTVFK